MVFLIINIKHYELVGVGFYKALKALMRSNSIARNLM
mgnify:CR=1 FL=1